MKSHLARMLPKLGVQSRLQAVVWAYQNRVVAVPGRAPETSPDPGSRGQSVRRPVSEPSAGPDAGPARAATTAPVAMASIARSASIVGNMSDHMIEA